MELQRREWLKSAGLGALGAAGMAGSAGGAEKPSCPVAGEDLLLQDFRPKSALHVPETRVETPRFPVIDVHTHLTLREEVGEGRGHGRGDGPSHDPGEGARGHGPEGRPGHAQPDRRLRKGAWRRPSPPGIGPTPGASTRACEPRFEDLLEPDYPQIQADAIEEAARAGAKGLKILKTLGLYLREQITEGPLVKVDDPRFDPMWEACAAHDLPVAIHVADPEAFFLPIDCTNERWDELGHHPDWSFHGTDFPSFREIMEARDRRLRATPEDPVPVACTSATTPRTWPSWASPWTASPT